MKVIFGLCCQSCIYPDISPSTTTTLTYLKTLKKPEQAPYIISKARVNITNLIALLKKTSDNGIKAFRLSDSFIPMADLGLYDIEKELGKSLE